MISSGSAICEVLLRIIVNQAVSKSIKAAVSIFKKTN